MSAFRISLGLLIAVFAILLLYRMRKLKPQVAGYGSQRMCPACGLITSRLKAYCLDVRSVSYGGECHPAPVRPNIPLQWSSTTGACTVYGTFHDFSF
jgi:hypothetical protein